MPDRKLEEKAHLLATQCAADGWQEIRLDDQLVDTYSLSKWSADFSLMTAGYRDRLDPDDAGNPEVPFNLVSVAILAESKARVFQRKLKDGKAGQVHIGGEVRPHTQEFIKLAARVYAAHGLTVHLRKDLKTTPVWYSSFGIFHQELDSGENFTASHSQYFKGGWKPLDAEGQQLLTEEAEIVAEVRAIVSERATIRLGPWRSNPLIVYDFDVDAVYASFQRSVIGEEQIACIRDAGRRGFRCWACTLGGSMRATTERLFSALGIPVGERGTIRYFMGEEDSQFHNVGQLDLGVDPGTARVYRNVGAEELLLTDQADLVLIWDPDGDRLKVIAQAPLKDGSLGRSVGLEVDDYPDPAKCIAYLTPNQLYLMLAAFRIDALRSADLLDAYDWFIGASVPTTQALDELALAEGLPCVRVPVGFKHIGDLCRQVENRLREPGPVSLETATGETVRLGTKPRALLLCEESGGAALGGHRLLTSKSGKRSMLALREKDGMQLGLLTIALGAHLHKTGKSLVQFFHDLVTGRNIMCFHYHRQDVRLYDESLMGAELKKAKAEGFVHRDRVMKFFRNLVAGHQAGRHSLRDIRREINARREGRTVEVPKPRKAYIAGDGVILESDRLRFIIRASGTDALLRYYVEGEDREAIRAVQRTLIDLVIP